MPMTWNADSDAKVTPPPIVFEVLTDVESKIIQLFLGVLAQFKPLKMKLDYEALAKYMGSDCTPCAIENRLVRLRRQMESVDFSTTPKTTPSSTPRKRKAASTPKTPTKKNTGTGKGKAAEEDGSDTEVDELPLKIEIKDDEVLGNVKDEPEEA
ncbi:uncharacterized protein KD926_002258 [Aspergillus affinis]|uniref:uncharacterized protein n=1 Tax=Aspergillus affinis TaxID=1070780 RepID=UPI0022FEEA85|nr:uncharacterized protein KD926_002258 [Aspergillus affinis]KAI9036117.1 hypothetical protein KD926_002258 [Aspergillus affinis]